MLSTEISDGMQTTGVEDTTQHQEQTHSSAMLPEPLDDAELYLVTLCAINTPNLRFAFRGNCYLSEFEPRIRHLLLAALSVPESIPSAVLCKGGCLLY